MNLAFWNRTDTNKNINIIKIISNSDNFCKENTESDIIENNLYRGCFDILENKLLPSGTEKVNNPK